MTAMDVKTMTVSEKMQLMEAIWEDFRSRVEESALPQPVQEMLDARRNRVASGERRLHDWDTVKFSFGRHGE